MELIEKFERTYKQYQKEKEERREKAKRVEGFVSEVEKKLEDTEYAVITVKDEDKEIAIGKKWVGIHPTDKPELWTFYIDREDQKTRTEVITSITGHFYEVLKGAIENPEKTEIQIREIDIDDFEPSYRGEVEEFLKEKTTK
ncbi:MAG: hypothetical protein QME61_02670, partial [Patescibacteria group bacterium]|nr:hypothetical protein [Patescibacteria group bacterium]